MATFDILIPVRDRAWTLRHTLSTILEQDFTDFRIVVCDNQSKDNLVEVLGEFTDPRIEYVRSPEPLSMTDNFEFALSHATGQWVACLGADDGLLPGCLSQVLRLAELTGCEAINGAPSTYFWPGLSGQETSSLVLATRSGHEVREIAPLRAALLSGALSFQNFPHLYTGSFVKLDLIQRARASDGRFYRSAIPDLYSSLVLSFHLDRYVHSLTPLALSGISPSSTGAAFLGMIDQADVVEATRQELRSQLRSDNRQAYLHLQILWDTYMIAKSHSPGLFPDRKMEEYLAESIFYEFTLLRSNGSFLALREAFRECMRGRTRFFEILKNVPVSFARIFRYRLMAVIRQRYVLVEHWSDEVKNIHEACLYAGRILQSPAAPQSWVQMLIGGIKKRRLLAPQDQ